MSSRVYRRPRRLRGRGRECRAPRPTVVLRCPRRQRRRLRARGGLRPDRRHLQRERQRARLCVLVELSDQRALQEEVERILDKINDNGFGSLSQKEKNTLDKAKGLLHRR